VDSFSVGFEWTQVVLETGDERYVLDGLRSREGVEDIAHHAGVDADVFGFGGLA